MKAPGSIIQEADDTEQVLAPDLKPLWQRLTRKVAPRFSLRVPLPGRVLSLRSSEQPAPAVNVAALPGVESVLFDTGGNASRRPITVIDAPPAIAAEMTERARTPIAPPETRVAVLDQVVVRDGVIETATGTIVADSLINRKPGEALKPFGGIILMRRLRNRPYVLLKQQWDANYGHWLVEGLPRLALVEERFKLADLGFIVSAHHGAMQDVYEDSLALFGIRRDQIVELGTEPVAVDRLIYPTPMTQHAWHIAPRCVSLLEQIAARVPAEGSGTERIYVSRNRAWRRRLVNEEEIVAIVRQMGFTVVEPEFLSLYQQIGLFRNARLVVGNYGAALTNIAFAAGRPTLLALTTPFMQDDFFSTLMSLKQGRFISLHGETLDDDLGMNADFRVDPPRFRSLLEGLL